MPRSEPRDLGICSQLMLGISTPAQGGTWKPWQGAKPRALTLHFGQDGLLQSLMEYSGSSQLQESLKQEQRSGSSLCGSVHILEAPRVDFTAVLQGHFHIHPSLFDDHNRLVAFDERQTGEGGGIPFLPCTIVVREHISLKYHEPLVFSPPPAGFRNLCHVSGRHRAVTRLESEFSRIGVARRKCTFWSRKVDNGRWDCTSNTSWQI